MAAIVELVERAEKAIETESFGKPGEFVCDQERRAFWMCLRRHYTEYFLSDVLFFLNWVLGVDPQ
jgi:hypothetical protein